MAVMAMAMAGCGALGSRIAFELARPHREFLLLDDDRVEERNIPASAFQRFHVRMFKAEALAEMLYYRAGCECRTFTRTLTASRLVSLSGVDLVVVTFDNAEARNLCNRLAVPVVQVGMSNRGTGLVHWGTDFDFGVDAHPRGQNPVCTGNLSSSLIRLTAAAAANSIEEWMETGRGRNLFVNGRNIENYTYVLHLTP